MKFKYRVNNKNEIHIEHYRYIAYKSAINKIKRKSTTIPVLISMGMLIYSLTCKSSIPFTYMLKLVIIAITAIIACFMLINYKRKRNNKIRRLPFIDAESVFEITIDDYSITRKDKFSSFKLPLSKVRSIDLLKNELVINFGNLDIFIPKDSLPLTVDKFIEFLKNKNRSINVIDYSAKIIRTRVRTITAIILVLILSVIVSYFMM